MDSIIAWFLLLLASCWGLGWFAGQLIAEMDRRARASELAWQEWERR